MVWVKAAYELGSLFSYRIPDYPSPSYALSSPLPGPSAIKLAIVATAIETTGKIDFGEKIFEIVKNAKIKIKIPKKIALSNMLIKRLKKKKEALELESTFGIRGYVHILEPLTIYINVDNKDGVKDLLKKIRRFGTSDSLIYCKDDIAEEEPQANCIEPVDTLEQVQQHVLLVPVKDLNPDQKIKFENVNPYVKSLREKDVFVKKFYLLPISKQIEGKNWIIYETS